jgi:hypothetical protein
MACQRAPSNNDEVHVSASVKIIIVGKGRDESDRLEIEAAANDVMNNSREELSSDKLLEELKKHRGIGRLLGGCLLISALAGPMLGFNSPVPSGISLGNVIGNSFRVTKENVTESDIAALGRSVYANSYKGGDSVRVVVRDADVYPDEDIRYSHRIRDRATRKEIESTTRARAQHAGKKKPHRTKHRQYEKKWARPPCQPARAKKAYR